MNRALTRVVSWGHELLAEVVGLGDLVVDLTAGNGRDSLVLYELVGDSGQVVAFDIQNEALDKTRTLLEAQGARVRLSSESETRLDRQAGIDLVAASHEFLDRHVTYAPLGIIANLGYLPGGDQAIITRLESTLSALGQAADMLAVKGRMAIVAYPGHSGGDEEAIAVTEFFLRLPEDKFQVLQIKVCNRPLAPILFVAEKAV